jgi:hypothetical protein
MGGGGGAAGYVLGTTATPSGNPGVAGSTEGGAGGAGLQGCVVVICW